MMPLFPKNGSVLKIMTHAQKEMGVQLHPSSLFPHKAAEHSGRHTDQGLGDASSGITESQNHRMVGVGRDLCGSPSPTPC